MIGESCFDLDSIFIPEFWDMGIPNLRLLSHILYNFMCPYFHPHNVGGYVSYEMPSSLGPETSLLWGKC